MKILLLLLMPMLVMGQTCLMTDYEMSFYKPPVESHNTGRSLQNHCLTVYLETDYFTVQSFSGDVDSVRTWMLSNWDSVKVLMLNEDVTINVTEVKIPTSPDWSEDLPGTYILYRFGIHAGDDVNGRFKHFMTKRDLGGGVAWLGGYCTPRQALYGTEGLVGYYGAYAVSGNLTKELEYIANNPWNYAVLAHEMGHNLGLNHTQDCAWGPGDSLKVDNCYPGQGSCSLVPNPQPYSIMSYCHLGPYGMIDLVGIGFGDLPGNRMRDNIGAAECLEYNPGLLVLVGLLDKHEYQADEIYIDHGANQGYITLRAPIVSMDGTTIMTNAQVYQGGCYSSSE